MTKLSVGQKRHNKDLRRKKRHPASKCPTQSKRVRVPFFDELFLSESAPQKLSAIMWDFASPLLDIENQPMEEVYGAIKLAITCWNIGLLSSDEQQKSLDSFLESAQQVITDTLKYNELEAAIRSLINTKQTAYKHDQRHIMGFDLSYGDNEYYLQVLSSFALPNSPEFTVSPLG